MNIDKIALEEEQRSRARDTKCITQRTLSQLGYIDGIILDCGCGYGFWTKRLEPYCKFIVGIDAQDIFDRDKISPKLDFVLADGYKLPFRDEAFKCVILYEVIEHVPDDFALLRECHRVLERGGCLLLSTPNKERIAHQIKK